MRFHAIGHVTRDLLPSGQAPGGSALYAALTAHGLGHDVVLHTAIGPDFPGAVLLERTRVVLQAIRAAATTCFRNDYVNGVRVQHVLAAAPPLTLAPPTEGVIFGCPVLGELAGAAPVPGPLVGIGLQGCVRALDDAGHVRPAPLPVQHPWVQRAQVLFVSPADLGGDLSALAPLTRGRLLLITQGAQGAWLLENEQAWHVPAFPAAERDPTGAGDVFATTFLLAYGSGASAADAARDAACVASLVVEGQGPESLADLAVWRERRAAYDTRAGQVAAMPWPF